MVKLAHIIEGLLLPGLAIVTLFVSMGDVFNFFHLIPVSQVPMILLILISLMLGTLAFIQNKCSEMLHMLEQLLVKTEQEQLRKNLARINPGLRKIVGDDYFPGLFQALETAITTGKVQVNGSSSFRLNFKRMLKAFPNATLLSTSSLATSYLWNEKDMEDALTHFINEGGKIKQIFFVRGAEEAASVEMQATLDLLNKIGITVHMVDSSRIPAHMKRYFIVESRGKIGWNIPVNDQGQVGLSEITADTAVTANYCKLFKTLWESGG